MAIKYDYIRMKLPNFIVIGAPKSGTTSLYFYLKQHPDVFLPVRKELHYFSYALVRENLHGPGDRDVLNWLCSNKQDYCSHYAAVKTEKMVGEISPSYLYYSQVSERIRSELGDIKIIAMLRNPVEKAFSQYMHLVREGRESLSFYDALMIEEQRRARGWNDMWRYAESSLYAQRLKKYIDVFGISNVKVILSEEFFTNQSEVMKDLIGFFGISENVHIDTSRIYNKTGYPKSELLAHFLTRPNLVRILARKVVPEGLRIALRLKITEYNTGGKDEIGKKSREYLSSYFHQDVKDLERMIEHRTSWL
jgi:hypothetical protein